MYGGHKFILVRHVVESLRQNIVYTPSTQHTCIKNVKKHKVTFLKATICFGLDAHHQVLK
jgi:hypothetical protein